MNMRRLLSLCQKYFGKANLYEVLKIPETSSEQQVKKAYYKMSLLVHPDRVEEDKKIEATEKFKVLRSVYCVLSDKEKRRIYDFMLMLIEYIYYEIDTYIHDPSISKRDLLILIKFFFLVFDIKLI
ncbi:J domain-containing protein CG6693-like [Prorops nasuta]|uniref:J domain-containing protein CG6693-like n=1 Tax=Prorops nasuta TaxID=863751 RepID=UPI0034CDD465